MLEIDNSNTHTNNFDLYRNCLIHYSASLHIKSEF